MMGLDADHLKILLAKLDRVADEYYEASQERIRQLESGEMDAKTRIRELEALLTAREDTLVCMREEYLHLRRITESARDLLQGEFYAEALGELDDACSPLSDATQDREGEP
jgi:triphosphoribosyl-dephospho-CoA synthetase